MVTGTAMLIVSRSSVTTVPVPRRLKLLFPLNRRSNSALSCWVITKASIGVAHWHSGVSTRTRNLRSNSSSVSVEAESRKSVVCVRLLNTFWPNIPMICPLSFRS